MSPRSLNDNIVTKPAIFALEGLKREKNNPCPNIKEIVMLLFYKSR